MTHGALALAKPALEPLPDRVRDDSLPDEVTPTPPPTSAVAFTREAPEPDAPPAASLRVASEAAEVPTEPLVVFRAILRRLAETRPALASIFEHASVRELTSKRAVFGFEAQSFAGAQAKEPEALDVVTRAVRSYFGAPTQVAIDLSAGARPGETVAVAAAAMRRELSDKARAAAAAHPLVVEALRLFGGELREVRLREEEE
jgi:DNA polymerase III subunit gamma/tau